MSIFDFIATTTFDKEGFAKLIDVDEKLDSETKQFYWDEFAIYHKQNLISFYRFLEDTTPTHQYIKKSMNQYFSNKAEEYLQ